MLHTYLCEMDLGLTYSLRNPGLAQRCFAKAMRMATKMLRPDLWYAANEAYCATL